jgi:hypothetical protein
LAKENDFLLYYVKTHIEITNNIGTYWRSSCAST